MSSYITTSSRDFLKALFGLEKYKDYEDETDESDLAFRGGRKWTLRMKEGNIMIFGLSYHDQGESQFILRFYAGPGKKVQCHGSTISPRYVAGGNGTYLSGEPGIHWNVDEVVACDMFLPVAFRDRRDRERHAHIRQEEFEKARHMR